MARSPLFDNLSRIVRIARFCESEQISTAEGMERIAHLESIADEQRRSRREFMANIGRAAVVGAAASLTPGMARAFPGGNDGSDVSVGIVGAGLAGLSCAYELKGKGITASLYEASGRAGGRCYSLRNFFPGQVAERGGEFIDTAHKTMLGYANQFNLTLEDVTKQSGDIFYYFNGQHYSESAVVDEFRTFVSAMRTDLRLISSEITATNHTANDVRLDQTNLLQYLEGHNGAGVAAGPIAKEAIIQAYIAEYGLAPERQSCLNFLLFIHADRRSKFTPFGIFSDERYHIIEGNDAVAQGLAGRLPGQIDYDMTLVRVKRTTSGGIELTFKDGTRTVTRTHDAVVLAVPFTVLRQVDLDASLGIPIAQRAAIANLGYGTNAKMMVGFSARPWATQGSNGTSYSNLANHQTTWETNPTKATSTRAIITDYSGAARGANLNPNAVQTEAGRFLTDLNRVYPGALAAATRSGNQYIAHLEHWPSNPLTRGSYTCYLPGQFTSMAGLEGKPVGNLHFAGEHANSFYEWQGFMEGAALSGLQAAKEILQDVKVGLLR
jgi:monoamine oxidase